MEKETHGIMLCREDAGIEPGLDFEDGVKENADL
jgi:hypothetical protein